MDSGTLATALISARVAQAQMAAAAKMMKNAQAADTSAVLQLLAAAEQSGQRFAAAAQEGLGQYVDFMA
jgi:hypothetical protein